MAEITHQLKTAYCSQDSTESPYCAFSVVRTLEGHSTVSALAISTDGKTLVSGGQDQAIKVWDLQTGKLRKTLQSDSGEIQTLAIAPDGKTVVSGSGDRMVRIWDVTSNQRSRCSRGILGISAKSRFPPMARPLLVALMARLKCGISQQVNSNQHCPICQLRILI